MKQSHKYVAFSPMADAGKSKSDNKKSNKYDAKAKVFDIIKVTTQVERIRLKWQTKHWLNCAKR